MLNNNRKTNTRYKELVESTIRILRYDEKREETLHKVVYNKKENGGLYEGYVIKPQYLTSNRTIDLICFRKMSNRFEIFIIEPDLGREQVPEILQTIHQAIDYFTRREDLVFGCLRNVEIVANLVTLAKIESIIWLETNKHLLQGSKINQFWIYGEKGIFKGNPYRFHLKHLNRERVFTDLKKIERGENFDLEFILQEDKSLLA